MCKSTYGDWDRGDVSEKQRRESLHDEVLRAAEAGGPLIIPSFAVERTQELLVDLSLFNEAEASRRRRFSWTSPLATRASEIF